MIVVLFQLMHTNQWTFKPTKLFLYIIFIQRLKCVCLKLIINEGIIVIRNNSNKRDMAEFLLYRSRSK